MRPKTTLFMLMSVDGKISTGGMDKRDVDKDFPKINGVKEGLKQYYDIEKTTDVNSLNSGRVMKKIGMNQRKVINCPPVSFIIIDNEHLKKQGVANICKGIKKLYLVTSNKKHPGFSLDIDNLEMVYYPGKIDFKDLFKKLASKYKMKRLTIQSGGTLNSILFREGLIDRIKIVVAPCLIGGKDTSSLVDGESLKSDKDLQNIKALNLIKVRKLKNNYLELTYTVK